MFVFNSANRFFHLEFPKEDGWERGKFPVTLGSPQVHYS